MKAKVNSIEIDVECENCQSNDFAEIYDPFNQDIGESLKEKMEEGWLFYQDAVWNEQPRPWMRDPADPKFSKREPNRDIFCFCSEECFSEWCDKEKDDKSNFVLCTEDELGYFEAKGFDDDLFITR